MSSLPAEQMASLALRDQGLMFGMDCLQSDPSSLADAWLEPSAQLQVAEPARDRRKRVKSKSAVEANRLLPRCSSSPQPESYLMASWQHLQQVGWQETLPQSTPAEVLSPLPPLPQQNPQKQHRDAAVLHRISQAPFLPLQGKQQQEPVPPETLPLPVDTPEARPTSLSRDMMGRLTPQWELLSPKAMATAVASCIGPGLAHTSAPASWQASAPRLPAQGGSAPLPLESGSAWSLPLCGRPSVSRSSVGGGSVMDLYTPHPEQARHMRTRPNCTHATRHVAGLDICLQHLVKSLDCHCDG